MLIALEPRTAMSGLGQPDPCAESTYRNMPHCDPFWSAMQCACSDQFGQYVVASTGQVRPVAGSKQPAAAGGSASDFLQANRSLVFAGAGVLLLVLLLGRRR